MNDTGTTQPKYLEKHQPSVTFSIINHTRSDLVLNQYLLRDRPGTKYHNHLKWGIAEVNTQMMTSWVHIHCFLAHNDIRTPFIKPKILPCWHVFESVSISVAHITQSTVQTLSDNGVLPKCDFHQAYFYLANQHKCTWRADRSNCHEFEFRKELFEKNFVQPRKTCKPLVNEETVFVSLPAVRSVSICPTYPYKVAAGWLTH